MPPAKPHATNKAARYNAANNCSTPIPYAQRKCPNGQAACPCSPQGLQASGSRVSTTKEAGESGPNPKAGTVLQNTAVTGAPTAEHKCMGAESFT